MSKQPKATVTMRALVQRINRKLEAEGEQLRGVRGRRWHDSTGDWFVVDVNRNALVTPRADPERLGRRLGVLHPWEKVSE